MLAAVKAAVSTLCGSQAASFALSFTAVTRLVVNCGALSFKSSVMRFPIASCLMYLVTSLLISCNLLVL